MSLLGLADLFRALALVCERSGYRWYVFGAQAVTAFGVPRLTADVDVTLDARGASVRDILAALAVVSIGPRAQGFDDLLERSRLLPLVHGPSRIPIDLVISAAGIEDDFFARAVTMDLGGVWVPILCIEDLIATKVVAGRRKDLEDVRGILRQRAHPIDDARLAAVLADFDAALEEPRAQATFARLAKAVRSARRPRR